MTQTVHDTVPFVQSVVCITVARAVCVATHCVTCLRRSVAVRLARNRPNPSPVATRFPCRNTRPKGLYRDRETSVATLVTQSSVATRGQAISIVTENYLPRQRSCGQSVTTWIFFLDKPSSSSRSSALGCMRGLGRAHAHDRVVRTGAHLSRALSCVLVCVVAHSVATRRTRSRHKVENGQ